MDEKIKSSHDFWRTLDSNVSGLVVGILTGNQTKKEYLLQLFQDSKYEFDTIRKFLNVEAIQGVKSEIC